MALNLTPNVGPWSAKISRIMKMWIQPCDVNAYVWMTAYMVNTPILAFALLSPDCLDYTVDRFRGGPRRRRKGKIKLAEWVKPITPGNSGIGQWMFSLKDAAQKVGLFLLVIDATLDWVIVGTSTAYQFTGCKDPDQGYASVGMSNQVCDLLPAATGIIKNWHVESSHIFGAGPTGIAAPRGHSVGCGFSLTQERGNFPGLPDCDWTASLFDGFNRALSPAITPTQEDNGNQSVTFFTEHDAPADRPHDFRIVYTKGVGVFQLSGHMSASGTNLEGLAKTGCGHNLPGGF